ncbi:hypothetical protein ACSBR2_023288 [Camellia fascicularis]
MVAEVYEGLYKNRSACGLKFNVRCIKENGKNRCLDDLSNFVTVKIVGLCPSTKCSTDLSLSKEAFSKICWDIFLYWSLRPN